MACALFPKGKKARKIEKHADNHDLSLVSPAGTGVAIGAVRASGAILRHVTLRQQRIQFRQKLHSNLMCSKHQN